MADIREFAAQLDGKPFPATTEMGGYPLIYILGDGEVLCAACANGENGSIATTCEEEEPQWRIIAADVFYEGAPEFCAHCNAEIESAYGDPDAEEEQAFASWDEAREAFDSLLDDTYPAIDFGFVKIYASDALKTDAVAYREGLLDWLDAEGIDTDRLSGT